jgi:hypothetical protein
MQEGPSEQHEEEEEVTADQQREMEEQALQQENQLMSITEQALETHPAASTPTVCITIGGKRTVALLDSGSTSTFIDQSFAIRANCPCYLQPGRKYKWLEEVPWLVTPLFLSAHFPLVTTSLSICFEFSICQGMMWCWVVTG